MHVDHRIVTVSHQIAVIHLQQYCVTTNQVLMKSPGWWWKFDKQEYFIVLSSINFMIMKCIQKGKLFLPFIWDM